MVLLPVAFAEGGSEEMRCAYVVLLMAAYWMTEALPLAITSLIPMVLLPFLGKCNNILKVQKKTFVKTSFKKKKILHNKVQFAVRTVYISPTAIKYNLMSQCELPK